MSINKNSFTYKPEDKGAKEFFSAILYRPVANFILLRFLKNTNISPNTVSVISLVTAAIASFFFFLYDYKYLILGVVFLHIAYLLDVLDGQLARYKDVASPFGRLFDSMLDIIKFALFFLGISAGIYARRNEPLILVLGLIALLNSFLTCYMLLGKQLLLEQGSPFTIRVTSSIYIGYEISFYIILTFFALINNLYLGMVFFATFGALSWIKIFIDAYRVHIKRSDGK